MQTNPPNPALVALAQAAAFSLESDNSKPNQPTAGTESAQSATKDVAPPLPGEWWKAHQGYYAGIMPALAGQPAYHLILDKDDLLAANGSADHEWGQYGIKIEKADSVSNGLANTKALVAANAPLVASMHSAPSVHLSTGASAAYIPSKREMALIVATCSEHMTAGEMYWTSSQASALNAWYQSFTNGNSNSGNKGNSLRVRPVRRSFL